MSAAQSTFRRDRFTWLMYLLLGIYAFYLTMLGPAATFLKDELELSYTVAGMHSSAFAIGMISIGAVIAPLVKRWDRAWLLWGSGLGMVLAAVLFVLAKTAVFTIAAAYLMGCSGTIMLTLIQATLADQHGENRTIALIEANITASAFGVAGAMLMGLGERSALGWRAALIFFGVIFVALMATSFRIPLPAAAEPQIESADLPKIAAGKLPTIFWILWLIAFLGVAIEWSMGYWGAEYLVQEGDLSKSTAAALMSLFFLSAVFGRGISSVLAAKIEVYRLLVITLAILLVGYVLYWLAPVAPLMVAGLFIGGFGVSNMWPLGLGAALSSVPAYQMQVASGRMTMASGSAILLAPQLLGVAADLFSLKGAYAAVILIGLIAMGLAVWVQRQIQGARA